MTRRLEPLDRVRELSDASVPIDFDVHALLFSEDAVGIEAHMHQRLADRRVNRVDQRRELSYATPAGAREHSVALSGNLHGRGPSASLSDFGSGESALQAHETFARGRGHPPERTRLRRTAPGRDQARLLSRTRSACGAVIWTAGSSVLSMRRAIRSTA